MKNYRHLIEISSKFIIGVTTVENRLKSIGSGILLLALVSSSAAAKANAQVVATQADLGNPPSVHVVNASMTSQPVAVDAHMHIGPGDLLNISVFDVPEMTQTIRVNDAGDATLNLVGALHLAGLTAFEAQASIASSLKAHNYLVDPQVSVFISEYTTQGVSILGEVHKPGVYQVLGTRTLLDIISEAGGITPFAGAEAMIKRANGDTVHVALTNDAQLSFISDVQIGPGDKVMIPRAGIVYVLGDVGRPGGFIMNNDGKITVLQAIALAGGPSHTSSLNHAQLIRKSAPGTPQIEIKVKQLLEGKLADMPLQSEDILYIPSSSTKTLLFHTAPSIASSAAGAAIYAAAY
jgi:polysaccharide biosynthesis/export protein